uniref:Histidine acid phosphatase family protein n=1 Tax=Caenorhabditis tropicalis TaxID=1561998 RepID=A0A1I7TF79_9PELO
MKFHFLYSFFITFIGFTRTLETNETVPEELKLVFVHTVWRHGDRSQEGHLNNDPVDPSKWIKGGGGYGQLTPEGMEQQFILGKMLRDRYIKTGFLHNFYDSQQIYIRSTDVNRTINSAFSNMLGMFSSCTSRPGIDYPDIPGWPRGFMPVPIHSSGPANEDCVASAFCDCKRREALLEIAHQGKEFQDYIKSEKYLNVTSQTSKLFNKTFTFDNLWKVHDAVYIQLVHFPETVSNQSWYSEEYFKDLEDLERPSQAFVSGLYNPPIVNGINVQREIVKTRGGPLINDISNRMRTKANCVKNDGKCDSYHRNLKYYAYSTHDHTVFALLVVLGLEDIVAGPEKHGEWPDYSSDILVELFHNSTDGRPYFRVNYLKNINSTFETVTHLIKGCEELSYCDFKVFESKAKEFRPDRPIHEFCQVLPGDENRVTSWFKEFLHEKVGLESSVDRKYWYLSYSFFLLFLFK